MDEHAASNDETWRNDSPENKCHIVGLAEFDDSLTIHELRNVVIDRWMSNQFKLRSFTRRRHGRLVWETCNLTYGNTLPLPLEKETTFAATCHDPRKQTVDICDLIRTHDLGAASDPEIALHKFLSDLSVSPLKPNMPLWEMYLINIPKTLSGSSVRSTVVLRCHHALMDGVACAHFLGNVLFDRPAATAAAGLTVWKRCGFFLSAAFHTLATIGPEALVWLFLTPESPLLIQPAPPVGEQRIVLPRRPALHGRRIFAPPASLSLSSVRRLSRRLSEASGKRFTVHDVLSACFVQAATSLRSGGCVVGREGILSDRPDDKLYTLLPMNCRTELPRKMDNFTAPVLVKHVLGNDGGRWSWDHLLAIQRENFRIKERNENLRYFLFQRMTSKCLPTRLANWVVNHAVSKAVCSVSNIVGPAEEASLLGKPIRAIRFWAPSRARVTVGLAFMSYNGQLDILASVDESEVSAFTAKNNEDGGCLLTRSLISTLIVEKFHQLESFV